MCLSCNVRCNVRRGLHVIAVGRKHAPLSANEQEVAMGFGRGLLFWLLGIPLPIIILLAIFWR